MAVATANCPKCNALNTLYSCSNCGNSDYRTGQLSDGSTGLICKACNLGFSHTPCQAGCGAMISATSFGTAISRAARNVQAGMEAYEGGKCFIATALYGTDSSEVSLLRSYRDTVLLNHFWGRRFVAAYYRHAPRILSAMNKKPPLHFFMKVLVGFAVRFVKMFHRPVFKK